MYSKEDREIISKIGYYQFHKIKSENNNKVENLNNKITRKQKNKNRYKTIRYLERYCNLEKKCQICGTKENVEIHHINYEDYLKINLLCKKHHMQVHKKEIERPEIIDLEKIAIKRPTLYEHRNFIEKSIEQISNDILNNKKTMADVSKEYHTSPGTIKKYLKSEKFEELKRKSKENTAIKKQKGINKHLTTKKQNDKMLSKRKENDMKMEKEVLTIRMPPELKKKLVEISKQKGLSINSIIVQTLWNISKSN